MIVYHGSNHNFTKLRINSALCRSEATKLNEWIWYLFFIR